MLLIRTIAWWLGAGDNECLTYLKTKIITFLKDSIIRAVVEQAKPLPAHHWQPCGCWLKSQMLLFQSSSLLVHLPKYMGPSTYLGDLEEAPASCLESGLSLFASPSPALPLK